jgi:L-alanine-DL-glutamate epimerase-like enolase superfamily enzyme
MDPLRFSIDALACHERPVDLRLPFRFGNATVLAATQAFVHARVVTPDGRAAEGWSAELMIPKWFDKDPTRSNARNVDDLRAAVVDARDAYVADRAPATAFGHAARHYGTLLREAERHGRNALTASYGPALVDRAVLDAACRLVGVSFADAVRGNLPGLDGRLTADLHDVDVGAFLATLSPRASIAARHTVGLADALEAEPDAPPGALPTTLAAVIARYGHRHFKLKLGGDVDADLERLVRIAAVLDRLPDGYVATLDGNEQFADAAAVRALLDGLERRASLQRLARAVLYLEQPLARDRTFTLDVHDVGRRMPLLIDEGDATLDAFPRARALGYDGVSSKSCKGFYKSLINAARCARANRTPGRVAFLSGEDLTSQAGIAVQQDLVLVGLLGLAHVERNGHHYVDGFAGQHASAAERNAFADAHPGLYARDGDNVRLRIRAGQLDLRSLAAPGYGAAPAPDVQTLAALRAPGTAHAAATTTTESS